MAEVGIHFEHIVVLVFDGPLESRNVSGTQAQLSFALYHEKTVGELLLHPLHNVGGTVRRVVFDNQNMKILLQSEDCPDDILDVFLFVIGRYDNDAVGFHGRFLRGLLVDSYSFRSDGAAKDSCFFFFVAGGWQIRHCSGSNQ